MFLERPCQTGGNLARPGERRVQRLAGEELGGGELCCVRASLKVLDRDDLADPGPVFGSDTVHDEVDGIGDEGVERREWKLARCLGQLSDETQSGQRLPGRPRVDGGEPSDA